MRMPGPQAFPGPAPVLASLPMRARGRQLQAAFSGSRWPGPRVQALHTPLHSRHTLCVPVFTPPEELDTQGWHSRTNALGIWQPQGLSEPLAGSRGLRAASGGLLLPLEPTALILSSSPPHASAAPSQSSPQSHQWHGASSDPHGKQGTGQKKLFWGGRGLLPGSSGGFWARHCPSC